jgi:predicted nucleic-acid-binding Zn-ribbon protein
MKIYRTKVQKISDTVTPFAGISFVNAAFHRTGLGKLIDKELGIRSKITGYSYSEIFRTWTNILLCGGDCAEDVQVHLRKVLEEIPGNRVPSADTLLRGIKELAVDNTVIRSSTGQCYNFNINLPLNTLLVKSLLLTGQLESGKAYDFDYDNQIIQHDKYDAKPTYKKTQGYFPGVATIGDMIVYIENRDGNANVKTSQSETLAKAYNLLKSNQITVNRSRMDAGSYSKTIIETVANNSKLFYIRANKCDTLTDRVSQINEWKTVEINYKLYQVASLDFTQFFAERGYRLVVIVMREKNNDGQLNLFTGDDFIYRCILTNDKESSEQEVIEYYNKRGNSEKIFDIQNNDFGWKHLPCSDMNYNTVYLIITAMIKNFYSYLVGKVSLVFKDIKPTSRLKRFIFRFISVSGQWVYRQRQWTLKLYTDRPYEKLII